MSNGSRNQRPIRVVFDTNVWISFLLGKAVAPELRRALKDRAVVPLFSAALHHELFDVLARPKFASLIEPADVEELRILLKFNAAWPEIHERIRACDDPKDDFLLELAVGGKADYLVTGDAALLRLNPFRQVQIMLFRQFVEDVLDGRKVESSRLDDGDTT